MSGNREAIDHNSTLGKLMKPLALSGLVLLLATALQGCTAVVVAADVAITGVSAVVGATTSVIGGAIDLVVPDGDDKKK